MSDAGIRAKIAPMQTANQLSHATLGILYLGTNDLHATLGQHLLSYQIQFIF